MKLFCNLTVLSTIFFTFVISTVSFADNSLYDWLTKADTDITVGSEIYPAFKDEKYSQPLQSELFNDDQLVTIPEVGFDAAVNAGIVYRNHLYTWFDGFRLYDSTEAHGYWYLIHHRNGNTNDVVLPPPSESNNPHFSYRKNIISSDLISAKTEEGLPFAGLLFSVEDYFHKGIKQAVVKEDFLSGFNEATPSFPIILMNGYLGFATALNKSPNSYRYADPDRFIWHNCKITHSNTNNGPSFLVCAEYIWSLQNFKKGITAAQFLPAQSSISIYSNRVNPADLNKMIDDVRDAYLKFIGDRKTYLESWARAQAERDAAGGRFIAALAGIVLNAKPHPVEVLERSGEGYCKFVLSDGSVQWGPCR